MMGVSSARISDSKVLSDLQPEPTHHHICPHVYIIVAVSLIFGGYCCCPRGASLGIITVIYVRSSCQRLRQVMTEGNKITFTLYAQSVNSVKLYVLL